LPQVIASKFVGYQVKFCSSIVCLWDNHQFDMSPRKTRSQTRSQAECSRVQFDNERDNGGGHDSECSDNMTSASQKTVADLKKIISQAFREEFGGIVSRLEKCEKAMLKKDPVQSRDVREVSAREKCQDWIIQNKKFQPNSKPKALSDVVGAIRRDQLDPLLRMNQSFNPEPTANGQQEAVQFKEKPASVDENVPMPPAMKETRPNTSPSIDLMMFAARQVHNDLIPFDGNPLEWDKFYKNFQNSTELCKYTNKENLARLQKAGVLTGKALKVTRNLMTHEDNVPRIIERLRENFGRPATVVNMLLENVKKCPPATKENLSSVVELAEVVDDFVSTCLIHDEYEFIAGHAYLEIVERKLYNDLRIDWAIVKQRLERYNNEHPDDPQPVMLSFNDWLKEIGKTFRKIDIKPTTSSSARNQARINVHNEEMVNSCWLCKRKNHSVHSCRLLLKKSVRERWNACKKEGSVCFLCLEKGHMAAKCNKSEAKCGVDDCNKQHHKLLHFVPERRNNSADVGANRNGASVHEYVQPETNLILHTSSPTLLKMNSVKVNGLQVNALLDDGSTTSLIDESFAQRLNVKGVNDPLCLLWSDKTRRYYHESRRLRVKISGAHCDDRKFKIELRTVEKLSIDAQTVDIAELQRRYRHLKGLPIEQYPAEMPMLILGLNSWRLTTPLKVKGGKQNEPAAMKTRLGWVVFGTNGGSQRENESLNIHLCECDGKSHKMSENFEQLVRQHISNEVAASEVEKQKDSANDLRAKALLVATTRRIGDRFETGLLWKNDDVKLM
jgi:Protein of unknown function (DUF1759)